jgi:mycothiol synthase
VIDEIRPATFEDFDAIIAINNATWPQFATNREEMLESDLFHKAKYHAGRLVALRSGKVLGVGQYDQLHTDYNPHTFWIEINVDPEHQHEGIGSALFARLLEEIRPYNPEQVHAITRDDNPNGREFFKHKGFEEAWIAYDAVLDLDNLDTLQVTRLIDEANRSNIKLLSLANLADDKSRDAKAFALHVATRRDAPMSGPLTDISFETYVETVLLGPVDPAAYFVAVKDEQYVGLAILEALPDEKNIRLVWLGTESNYRRLGIASALLARSATYAKSLRLREIHTSCTSLNPQMLSVCDRFGFVRPYGLVHVRLDLRPVPVDNV